MRRFISIITMMCLLLTVFVPLAMADTDFQITSVAYTSEGDFFTLTVKGSCAAGTRVSLLVKNENGTLRAIEQCKAETGNVFSKEVVIDSSDDTGLASEDGSIVYSVYARNYNNEASVYTLALYSDAGKERIISLFNEAADSDTMTDCIERYYKVFGFDMTYYSGMESEVAKLMLSSKNSERFTIDNIVSKYNESVIYAYLFNSDFSADRTAVIEYPDYDAILRFSEGFDGAQTLYTDYKAMTDAQRKKVNEIAFCQDNLSKSLSEIKELFFMAVTAERFEDYPDDYATIYKFLKNHNDWFGLEKLESLTTYQSSQIIGSLVNETIPDNKSEFVALYNKYLNIILGTTTDVSKPSTGGTGSVGGGGGAGGSVIGETSYDPSSVSTVPVIDNTAAVNAGFNDLDGYIWANEAISTLYNMKIIDGKGDNKFAPGDNITREEFAKILVNTYGLYNGDAECDFPDISSDRWSYKYVASIYRSGIVTGYQDGTFGPENSITREEMAVMMARTLIKLSKLKAESLEYSAFNDSDTISDYASNSVFMLYNAGIISGDDTGNFHPKSGATRAEVCQMIYNSLADEGRI